MFETVEPVARRWPLLMYGTYCFAGLAFVVISVSRHGFSQPVRLVLSGVMFGFDSRVNKARLPRLSPKSAPKPASHG
jgi:hypothetical protein